MRTKDQHRKIWRDMLSGSKEFPKDIAEKFFISDNIDPLKFKENHDYYVTDRYGHHTPTPSCFDPLDAPGLLVEFGLVFSYPVQLRNSVYPNSVQIESFWR